MDKEAIKRASEIAVKDMREKMKEMRAVNPQRFSQFVALGKATFTPNKLHNIDKPVKGKKGGKDA